jgi:thioredoxin 2
MIAACRACSKANRVPARRLGERAKCAACKAPLLPFDRPVEVATAEDFDELIQQAPLPVLVDYWAAWCGPCRMVAPELEKLAGDRPGRLVIAKVDTDALPEIATRFAIRSIPTMILFRNGEAVEALNGAMPASAIAARLGI